MQFGSQTCVERYLETPHSKKCKFAKRKNAITLRNGISQLGHQKLFHNIFVFYQQPYLQRKVSETLNCKLKF